MPMRYGLLTFAFLIGAVLAMTASLAIPVASRTGRQSFERSVGRGSAKAVAALSGGGVAAAGFTPAAAVWRLWLAEFDRAGHVLWRRAFAGQRGGQTLAMAAFDGGFLLAGATRESADHEESDAWALRLDVRGSTLWERTYGGAQADSVKAAAALADGGFALAGRSLAPGAANPEGWLIRLDAQGEVLWDAKFGSAGLGSVRSLAALPDGGFFLVGLTDSKEAGDLDAAALRLDSSGRVLWRRVYGGSMADIPSAVLALSGGDFFMAGWTYSQGSGMTADGWFLRLNAQGAVLWERKYGGPLDDWASSAAETPDGGVVVAGGAHSLGRGAEETDNAWITKLSPEGEILWRHPGGGREKAHANSVAVLPDGKVAVVGEGKAHESEAWLLVTPTELVEGTPVLQPSTLRAFRRGAPLADRRSANGPLPPQGGRGLR
jgi:hypothetical protein